MKLPRKLECAQWHGLQKTASPRNKNLEEILTTPYYTFKPLIVLWNRMDSIRFESMHVWNNPCKGSFLREYVVIKSSPIGHRFVIAA